MSLTVALEGTSRRGHFICRYCTGDRKHKAPAEMRPREHPQVSRGGAVQAGLWLVRCNRTCSFLLSVHVIISGERTCSESPLPPRAPSVILWGTHNRTTNQSVQRTYRRGSSSSCFGLQDKQGSSRDQELPHGGPVPFVPIAYSITHNTP